MKRWPEVIAAYDQAIRLASAGGQQRLGSYYLRRSQAWWELRDRARALADAREALRLGAKVDAAYLRGLGE